MKGESQLRELVLQLLHESVEDGKLAFEIDGELLSIGKDSEPPRCVLRVKDDRFFSRLIGTGNLGLGEAFILGEVEVAEGELHDFLIVCLRNRLDEKLGKKWTVIWNGLRVRLASLFRSRAVNVRSHYDQGNDLFEAFLDDTLAYSCGYSYTESESLATLQTNKYERICRKLDIQPNDQLLDIGCGFGGLMIYAATHFGAKCVGVTNSLEHARRGSQAAEAANAADSIEIRCADFTSIEGCYDRVVSVGMLEHVPRQHYRRYFNVVAQCLRKSGRGLVHFIGCNASRNQHDPFTQKYIFPGANQPRLSEVAQGLERSGLPILDVENMVRHYAPTVRGWLERFRTNRDKLQTQGYDERFLKMWEYYLHCGIAGATASEAALYQVLFSSDRATPMRLNRI